jgi:hypothetical protein
MQNAYYFIIKCFKYSLPYKAKGRQRKIHRGEGRVGETHTWRKTGRKKKREREKEKESERERKTKIIIISDHVYFWMVSR